MKALFVTYDGLTDPLGQSQILPYFKGLSKNGHNINILSCEKPAMYEKNESLIHRLCKESDIIWEYEFYTKTPPVLSTFFDLNRMKKKAIQMHQNKNFDIVHCRTILTTDIGLSLQERGVRFIFDIRGFWSDERVDGNLWSLSNPLYYLIYNRFKRKEKKCYEKADQIITLTKNAKNHLVNRFELLEEKIAVVPCTVDLQHFSLSEKIEKQSERLKYELDLVGNYPIICYSGSLGTRYLIDEMLNCFQIIQKKFENSKFLIVSHSDTFNLMKHAKDLGIENKIQIISTSYQEIPQYINLADIALYFIFAGNSGKAVSPTKQAEFLSLGVPIITNNGIGDSEQIINENKVGAILSEFTTQEYNRISEQVPVLLKKEKAEIVNIATKYFDLKSGIDTYHKVYQDLC